MKFTEIIVKRPVAALMIIVGILVFGLSSVTGMQRETMPEMTLPMMVVVTTYNGASPENVEKLVSSKIEDAVGTLSGLDTVSSTSAQSVSIVSLEFKYGTNMDTAYIDVRAAIDEIANDLPDNADSPLVMQISVDATASMNLSVRGDREDLLLYVEEDIKKEFEKLASVARVSVTGGQKDYISVELDEVKLQQYGLNMEAVAASVATADFSMPSGEMDHGNQKLTLNSAVSVVTNADLADLPIALGNGASIRLGDVARVYDARRDAQSSSRFNGEDAINIALTKRQSASAVTLSKEATEVIQRLNTSTDVQIEVINDERTFIDDSINSVIETLVLAVIISMLVLFVFFGNLRASLIVGSSMPISLLATFIAMNVMGFTLNMMTTGALVLGVGMMVDNSIVVIDSCFKSAKERNFVEAAVEGTKFVALSIAASTITTVVVFLPLAMTGGFVGMLFKPLGFTVAFSLLASLFSAMTLIPLFFVQFKPVEKKKIFSAFLLKKLERVYAKVLKKILNKKVTAFVVSLGIVAVSLFLAGGLDSELMTAIDEGTIRISIETRPGVQLGRADAIVREIEEMVASHEDVERYFAVTQTGSGGFDLLLGDSSTGTVTAYLSKGRGMSTDEIVEQWRLESAAIQDCDIIVNSSSSTTDEFAVDHVSVRLQGTNLEELREFATGIVDRFRAHPAMITVTSSLSDGNPQAEIIVDSTRASAYDLTPQEVSGSVYQAIEGVDAAEIARSGIDYTVTVEYPGGKYTNMTDVENMLLTSSTGKTVALRDIARIRYSNAPQNIEKENNQYIVTIKGTPYGAELSNVQQDMDRMIADMALPEGISLALSFEDRIMDEAFESLFIAIAAAVLLVFMVMAIQFESIKHSVMVMICIPFSLLGSFGFLALTGATLNIDSLMGFLVLVGTVVNNGILFVDTTNEYRRTMDVQTALIRTGRHRLRPILMTTLTTVLSMIPMAMALGTGTEATKGMGLVVIGGLTASTLLTLLLLPTFYLIIDGNPEKRQRRKDRRQKRREESITKTLQENATVPEDGEHGV